ncbi:MAG TPA: MBL fold metallo-hydrolase [Acidimicrobiales bacterium]|jgi:glyoxylase-like metal-dependent hydrolase (beta-lactamase superfamily II)|nr:MBL fold metallo-hydrolase [Acidimicrobiales bacterium]
MTSSETLYFKQLLAGRDFARSDPIARQMVNFVYLIGDRSTGEAVAVDPAYAPGELIDLLEADGLKLVGALATHYHADHVGGSLFGHPIAGLTELLERASVPVHVQSAETPWVVRAAGVGQSDLVEHAPGDVLAVGGIEISLVHTPGHTPGSQCFLVDGRLVAGDTLFLNGCGRTDLPGSDPEQMYDSLFKTLSRLPGSTVVYPGHLYSDEPSASLEDTRRWNPVLAPRTPEEWLNIFGP